MNQYTDQDFDNMTRDQLVAVFQDMLNEIGLMLEAATTKIREQNDRIDELERMIERQRKVIAQQKEALRWNKYKKMSEQSRSK